MGKFKKAINKLKIFMILGIKWKCLLDILVFVVMDVNLRREIWINIIRNLL